MTTVADVLIEDEGLFVLCVEALKAAKMHGSLYAPGSTLAHFAKKAGLLEERGHDGLGGIAHEYTEKGRAFLRRAEIISIRAKIKGLAAEVEAEQAKLSKLGAS